MKQLENTLKDLKCMLIEDGYKDDNIVLRTLIRAQQQVKKLNIPDVSTCGVIQEHQMSDEFRKSIESIDEAMGW